MPCWEVNTISVEFHVANKDVLIDALESMGVQYSVSGNRISLNYGDITLNLTTGTAELKNRTQQTKLNLLKQAYSETALKKVAKLNGWAIQGNGKQGILLKGMI